MVIDILVWVVVQSVVMQYPRHVPQQIYSDLASCERVIKVLPKSYDANNQTLYSCVQVKIPVVVPPQPLVSIKK